jgi:DNA-binding NarL/FixJ family response regulator
MIVLRLAIQIRGRGVSSIWGPMRVLLADNHIVIRGGLRALLRAQSDFHICAEVDNGRDAVNLTIRNKPDIAIINVNLPGINGIEATRQIRSQTSVTEILIFTAENNEDLAREAFYAGARGYLLKSAADEEVIEAIEAVSRHQAFCSRSVSHKWLGNLAQRIRDVARDARLTSREQQIVQLVASGYRGKTIALMLGISKTAVETHRESAMRKLELRSIADVVHYARRENLV